MPRTRIYSPEKERYIGRVCLRARRRGIAWKVIGLRFNLGRKKLWHLARAEADRKGVSKHIDSGHRPPRASEMRA